MNEIVGSVTLTIVFAVIVYFMVASKLKFGFDATIAFGIPTILLVALATTGVSIVMGFVTLVVALLVTILFNKIIGNR